MLLFCESNCFTFIYFCIHHILLSHKWNRPQRKNERSTGFILLKMKSKKQHRDDCAHFRWPGHRFESVKMYILLYVVIKGGVLHICTMCVIPVYESNQVWWVLQLYSLSNYVSFMYNEYCELLQEYFMCLCIYTCEYTQKLNVHVRKLSKCICSLFTRR